MNKTNLFIVGAPKCGTTAMVEYLSESSEIFFPKIKEPHYFCSDFPGVRRITSEKQYGALYEGAGGGEFYNGDASVWYLYSKDAAVNIFKYNPDSKIIIMIRNPTTMLPSLHNQLVFSGRENIDDFDKAWRAVSERREGRSVPPNSLEPSHLYYQELCKYSEQIERYKNIFPSSSVKVVVFDDFISDTKKIVDDVFDFLGVEAPVSISYASVNKSRVHKFPRLMHMLQFPPFPISILKKIIKKIGFVRRNPPLRGVYAYFSMDKQVKEVSQETKEMIKSAYAYDVDRLRSVLNIDVNQWLR